MVAATTLYDQVVQVAAEYLGPTADRFVSRQIQFHLDKKPRDITPGDIPKIKEWITVSIGLLTEDKQLVRECGQKIDALAR